MIDENVIGKKVKVTLKEGIYYKGIVLTQGVDFIKIRDIRDNIVFISVDSISVFQEWVE